MLLLVLIQMIVPLILIASLALRTRSPVTKAFQAATVLSCLFVVNLTGIWTQLPWWTPHLYWPLFLASLLAGVRPKQSASSARSRDRFGAAIWGLAAFASTAVALFGVLGQMVPSGQVVDLRGALPPGRYLVVNGGNSIFINAHLETLRPETPKQVAHRGQSYGVDIVGIASSGRTSNRCHPREPERYAMFGTPILAPCSGSVVKRLDGRPDMPVPRTDEQVMTGNFVLLQCEQVEVLLAHMRNDSVLPQRDEFVRVGQKIGEVGNSGNSSEPHLHIHAQKPGTAKSPLATDPLPLRIDGRYLVRGDRF